MSGRVSVATRPVWMSSLVVPPTSGLNTSLDSPNTPWQDAHLASQTSCPGDRARTSGRPLKSGARRCPRPPLPWAWRCAAHPGISGFALARAMPPSSTPAKSQDRVTKAGHSSPRRFPAPARSGWRCCDRSSACRAPRAVAVGGLHVARLVGGAALQMRRLAVPHPVELKRVRHLDSTGPSSARGRQLRPPSTDTSTRLTLPRPDQARPVML
jgi:hypothetical protein